MGGLFPIYKETGSGVMFVYALGAMRAVCVVCVGGGVEAGDGWGEFGFGERGMWVKLKNIINYKKQGTFLVFAFNHKQKAKNG